MKLRAVLSAFAMLLTISLSTYALDTKCVVVGPAASGLYDIAHEASDAQLLAFSLSSNALKAKCVVVGPAASELSEIAREASDAQIQADEIESYLRSNGSPDRQWVASTMDYLKQDVQNLQKSVAGFERSEPVLTEAQGEQLERLKAGLATLTVFVNNTYQLLGDEQLMPQRDALISNAKAISVRADIIRNAVRSIRVAESA
ncbi:MAG: hypothetical protein WB762_19850 [Candidatus Sulfotelmatobacter sp.]